MRERAVDTLRAELAAAALDRATIAELVDHFESIVDERLAAGDDLVTAIAVARTRLGEPAAIAREHARVRSPFGARPSRLAAWSAVAALLLFPLIAGWNGGMIDDLVVGPNIFHTIAIAILLLRRPQAAAFLLGFTLCELGIAIANGVFVAFGTGDVRLIVASGLLVGICVVLAAGPWTRWRVATVALGWVANLMLQVDAHTYADHVLFVRIGLPLALVLAVLAVGARARFARMACGILCVLLLPMAWQLARLLAEWLPPPEFWQFDAVSWYVAHTTAHLVVAITVIAPVVAVVVARGGRATRSVIDEVRARLAPPSAPA